MTGRIAWFPALRIVASIWTPLPCTAGSIPQLPEDLISCWWKAENVGCTSRPARPARCIAADFVMSLVKSVSKPTESHGQLGKRDRRREIEGFYCTSSSIPSKIALLLTLPCINDIFDSGNGDRCLCDISSQYTLSSIRRCGMEHFWGLTSKLWGVHWAD